MPFRFQRRAVVLAAIIPLAAVPSCADPRPPTFTVIDAAVTERTRDAVVVTFTIEGSNTSDQPIPLDNVNYALSLNGRQVFAGARSSEAALPAGATQRVRLPVPVPTENGVLASGVVPYRLSGTMLYRLPGTVAEVFFDTGVRRPSVSFSESGSLDLTQAAP